MPMPKDGIPSATFHLYTAEMLDMHRVIDDALIMTGRKVITHANHGDSPTPVISWICGLARVTAGCDRKQLAILCERW